MERVTFDVCQYGEAFKKRTTLYVSGSFLRPLQKLCDGKHAHVALSGWRDLARPTQKRRRTADAAAYVPMLCQEWATAVKNHLRSSELGA